MSGSQLQFVQRFGEMVLQVSWSGTGYSLHIGLWSVHLVLPRSSWNGWRGGNDPSEQEVRSEGRFAPWKAYFCTEDASVIQASG